MCRVCPTAGLECRVEGGPNTSQTELQPADSVSSIESGERYRERKREIVIETEIATEKHRGRERERERERQRSGREN